MKTLEDVKQELADTRVAVSDAFTAIAGIIGTVKQSTETLVGVVQDLRKQIADGLKPDQGTVDALDAGVTAIGTAVADAVPAIETALTNIGASEDTASTPPAETPPTEGTPQ